MAARPLTRLDAFCLGINAIVGTSIFLFPGILAQQLGPASILSFGLTGLALMPVALCFAQASLDFDRHGGPYLYARSAFGPNLGFSTGWLCWAAEVLSWAAVASGISTYLGYFDPVWASPIPTKLIAATVIIAMGALNYRGVKLGAWTTDLLTFAKLAPLLAFALVGLWHVKSSSFLPFAPHGWAPMGQACFLAAFAYSGFEVVPVPAGELRNPRRDVPLAVIGSLALSGALYMLVQSVAVGVHPGIAGSERPLADAAATFLGHPGASLMAAGAAISMIGFNAGCALGGPRYLVALAENGDLPEVLAASHPRFGTPHRSIALTSALALAAAIAFDFRKLVDFSVVVICAQYAATCAAVPVLQRRAGRRGAGAWTLAALGLLATAWIGSQAGKDELKWSTAALAAGWGIRLAHRRRP